MNFIKKKYLYLLVINIIFSNILGADIDEIDNIEEVDIEREIIPEEPNNTTILGQILGFHIDSLIRKDYFLKTHTVLKRPVQTLPIFNLYHTDHICQDWLFRFSLFGNKTERAFFSKNSPHIKTFFDLEDRDVIDTLKKLPKLDYAENCVEIFKHAKKEERRAGLMIQGLKNFDDFSLEFDVPLFYEERNYFFTPAEKEQIEDCFNNKPTKDEEKEYRRHALADKFGFGDTRIKLGYLLVNRPNIALKIGVQTTIPTAFALKKGLLGSDFKKTTEEPRPRFDFDEFSKLKDEEDLKGKSEEEIRKIKNKTRKIKDKLFDQAMRTVDWLSAMVLDAPLGNSRHFGIGGFIEPQIKLNESVTIKTLSYIEYFFPSNEKRFFLQQKNLESITQSELKKASQDDDASKEALGRLEEALAETLFPQIHKAQVTPGFMFQLTVGPQFRLREWDFLIAYDFWYQQAEKVDFIFDNPNNLRLARSTKPKAFQSKMFLKLAYNKIEPNRDWSIALSYEDSLATKGIGKDFAVAFSFEINY